MRLFFALPVEASLALAIEHWRKQNIPLAQSPVPAANFHITLAFLGEVSANLLDALCRRAEEISHAPFAQPGQLHLDTMGYWPKPGILWIGPKHWPTRFGQLASALFPLGKTFGSHRGKQNFQPHVTLYRHCESPPQAIMPPDFLIHYSDLVLFESINGKSGVRYQECASWPLQARPVRTAGPRRPGLGSKS